MNQQQVSWPIVLLIVAGVWLAACSPGYAPSPAPAPTPGVVVPGAPTVELQGLVARLKQIAATNPAAAKVIGKAFRDLATVLPHAGLKTNSDLRALIEKFERIYGPTTTLKGGLPGFSAEANTVLKQSLGDDDVALNQAKAVDALNAIAWACGG